MMRLLLLSLLLAAPAAAEDAANTDQQTECQSCTARHKAMQKLQQTRLVPAIKTPAEPTTIPEQPADE